jgi:hypothetical protein
MAVGQVSSISGDNWQLIATNSPTSGTTTTFSGLSGYKKYILAFSALNSTNNPSDYKVTFNSSSSGYTSRSESPTSAVTSNEDIRIGRGTALDAYLTIDNANLEVPKIVQGVGSPSGSDGYLVYGAWVTASAITSITITISAGTYNSGSVRLYGVAA